MIGRRELLGAAVVGTALVASRSEACTIVPGPPDAATVVKDFTHALAFGSSKQIERFLWKDLTSRLGLSGKRQDRRSFLKQVSAKPKVGSAGIKIDLIDVDGRQLIQKEFERYVDLPSREVDSCGFMFNYDKRLAVYELAATHELIPISLLPVDGASDRTLKKAPPSPPPLSLITSLTYLELPINLHG